MKKIFAVAMMLAMTGMAWAQTTEQLLLSGWRFHRGAAEGAEQTSYNDQQWQRVTIPHDWAITGPFDKEIDKQVVAIKENGEQQATEKTGRSGSLPWIGEGWYRTEVTIPEGFASGELVFDGAMAEPHVWMDGVDIGYWAYGYNTFSLPLTGDRMKPGKHTVAVHLQNVEESSRWYPGAGLFRPVRLVLHPEVYLQRWETFVRTTRLEGISSDHSTASLARLTVSAQLNQVPSGKTFIRQTLTDMAGNEVARSERELWNKFTTAIMTLDVKSAQLWSPEHPTLYILTSEVRQGDKVVDRQVTRVGIRQTEYTQNGYFLNGEQRKFKGVCLHHDMGPTGTAFYKDAFRRQVRLLKEMGCDAIRTSHNTPCPWQLDICDSLGMMVMAESFDMWKSPKCKNGYARFFDVVDTKSPNADGQPWYIRDITNLVKVNRNHASVVMWSIGNEIPEQGTADGLYYTNRMQDLIHQLDGTRPCTQGMNHGQAAMMDGVWQTMDVPGWNYHVNQYLWGEQNAKNGIIIGSETASTVSSRGVYKFPVKEEIQTDYPDGQVSSYDLEKCFWSNLPDDDWMLQDKDPHNIGEFVWTGFDYLGEPTPYDNYWPSRSSYFGIYDLAGLPKDRVYLYRTHWAPERETLHLLPHWTWPGREGEVTPVYCYTNYPSAELFINGKSQGRLSRQDVSLDDYLRHTIRAQTPWGKETFADPDATPNRLDRYRLRWNNVKYEPGELKIVAYDKDGREAATQVVRTAGKPDHIVLCADQNASTIGALGTSNERSTMKATPVDSEGRTLDTPSLTYYTVSVVDKDGNLCPDADMQLTFKVSGKSAQFNSCCNGDATSLEVFTQPTMKVFHGQLVVVLAGTSTRGTSTLTVSGKGVKSAKAMVITE